MGSAIARSTTGMTLITSVSAINNEVTVDTCSTFFNLSTEAEGTGIMAYSTVTSFLISIVSIFTDFNTKTSKVNEPSFITSITFFTSTLFTITAAFLTSTINQLEVLITFITNISSLASVTSGRAVITFPGSSVIEHSLRTVRKTMVMVLQEESFITFDTFLMSFTSACSTLVVTWFTSIFLWIVGEVSVSALSTFTNVSTITEGTSLVAHNTGSSFDIGEVSVTTICYTKTSKVNEHSFIAFSTSVTFTVDTVSRTFYTDIITQLVISITFVAYFERITVRT
jgi:hypothetical protein